MTKARNWRELPACRNDIFQILDGLPIGREDPHVANLFYACDGFALIWLSDPASRHSRDVDAEPRVAATIAADFADFTEIRGLQIRGQPAE